MSPQKSNWPGATGVQADSYNILVACLQKTNLLSWKDKDVINKNRRATANYLFKRIVTTVAVLVSLGCVLYGYYTEEYTFHFGIILSALTVFWEFKNRHTLKRHKHYFEMALINFQDQLKLNDKICNYFFNRLKVINELRTRTRSEFVVSEATETEYELVIVMVDQLLLTIDAMQNISDKQKLDHGLHKIKKLLQIYELQNPDESCEYVKAIVQQLKDVTHGYRFIVSYFLTSTILILMENFNSNGYYEVIDFDYLTLNRILLTTYNVMNSKFKDTTRQIYKIGPSVKQPIYNKILITPLQDLMLESQQSIKTAKGILELLETKPKEITLKDLEIGVVAISEDLQRTNEAFERVVRMHTLRKALEVRSKPKRVDFKPSEPTVDVIPIDYEGDGFDDNEPRVGEFGNVTHITPAIPYEEQTPRLPVHLAMVSALEDLLVDETSVGMTSSGSAITSRDSTQLELEGPKVLTKQAKEIRRRRPIVTPEQLEAARKELNIPLEFKLKRPTESEILLQEIDAYSISMVGSEFQAHSAPSVMQAIDTESLCGSEHSLLSEPVLVLLSSSEKSFSSEESGHTISSKDISLKGVPSIYNLDAKAITKRISSKSVPAREKPASIDDPKPVNLSPSQESIISSNVAVTTRNTIGSSRIPIPINPITTTPMMPKKPMARRRLFRSKSAEVIGSESFLSPSKPIEATESDVMVSAKSSFSSGNDYLPEDK